MGQPGRQYTAGTGYRYGFNGKENDNEVKGEGNQQDYGMRIYDPRLGRFLSLDPLQKNYPMLTPYQYSSNRPIDGIDLDGREYITFQVKIIKDANGNTVFKKQILLDFRGRTGAEMAAIHKNIDYVKNFYSLYSESFGPEGRGFKWIYVDENEKQIGDPVWQMRQPNDIMWSLKNSGYYSGEGSITENGPGTSRKEFAELNNDYDFSYKPMGYADLISKNHDMMQAKTIPQPQGWLEDVRTLPSDYILVKEAKIGLETGKPNSLEDVMRTSDIIKFFKAAIRYKEWKVNYMNENKLNPNSISDQRRVILKDWKVRFLSRDWWNKILLSGAGGGAREKERNTVKPIEKKRP